MKNNHLTVVHSFPVWLPQTQTWMYNQLKYLPDSVEAHVVCERTANLDQFEVPNIHALMSTSQIQYFWEKILRSLKFQSTTGFLTQKVREIQADIVHSHFGHIGWTNLYRVKQTRSKHIVSFYGADVSQLPKSNRKWKSRYQNLFENGDAFLSEGPHMTALLIELGCPREKVVNHLLGVEISKIPYRPRRWRRGEPLRILIAAGFREKKGITYAIQAAAQIKKTLPIAVTIIGDASTQSSSQLEKKRILKLIHSLALSPDVTFLGFQPFPVLLEEAYKHHVFLSPSITAVDGDSEGGAPVTLIEMIASGMPVISTMHCDIPQVVQYGINNWLVEERNVSDLANRLNWLVENSKRWSEFLEVGRHHVEKNFDAKIQGARLESIYHSVLNS